MPKSSLCFFRFHIAYTARIISLLLAAGLLLPCIVYGEINIDGLIDESE